MKDRLLTVGLLVIVAIFAGVTIIIQQTTNPVLRQVIVQQKELLVAQKRIEDRLAQTETKTSGTVSAVAPIAGGPAGSLDAKLSALERKMDILATGIGNLRMAAQQPAQQRPTPPQEDYDKVYQIDVGKSPVRGKTAAPVTIVEFVDFQCPFCSRFHIVLDEVIKANPDKVNYVLKQFPLPFHPQAKPAGKAALAAGEQGKYWEMVDIMFQNQRELNPTKYEEWAKTIGLNVKKFKKDLADKDAEYEKIIEQDTQLGRDSDVRGTPTFFINGRKTRARDLGSYQQEINTILSQAGK